ncbi:MAG: carboxypeptidase-like regulatory domain-containing protein [Acidobacteriota bacterium]
MTGAVLRGEVGVIGATVRALHVGRSGGAKEVSTGGGGHFSLRGLLSGDYAVYVHERGRLIAHRRLRLVSEDHWRIEVSGTKVGGRVLDGGGEPISGADVYLNPAEDRSGYGTSFGKTDREGAFVIPDVAPGRYRLNALAKEHAPGHLHLNVDESDVTGLELLLGETVELVMSPRRSDGSVPSRVVLRLFDGGGRRLHAEVGRPDDGGVVRFRRLKAGLWNATLQDDHNNEMPLRVEIPGDAGAIHMPPSGRLLLNAPELGRDRVALRYRLLDAEGRPYLGTPEFSEWIPPDAQDLRLPAGHWTLEIEAGDGRSWKLPATVADSAETALAIP